MNYSAQCSAGSSASSSFRLVVRLLARLHFGVRLAWLARRCGRLRFLVRSTFGHVSGVCGARLLVEVICHRGVSVLVLDPFIFHEFVFVLEMEIFENRDGRYPLPPTDLYGEQLTFVDVCGSLSLIEVWSRAVRLQFVLPVDSVVGWFNRPFRDIICELRGC